MSTKPEQPNPETLEATAILDYRSSSLQRALQQFDCQNCSKILCLRKFHEHISEWISPVYTLDELQPASVTYEKRRGSCSQRMACLEALSRASGIATRVRALWIDGRFWNPRFKLTSRFIPSRIL